MRKVIAAINMTLDGFCDHEAIPADEAIHQHYTELLRGAGTYVTGRITYQLMEYWKTLVANPTGKKDMDEFAAVIDDIEKVVFSRTLKNVNWRNARLARKEIKDEIAELRQSVDAGNTDIVVGSRSLIVSLSNLDLIDEYQFCVHPVVAGSGLLLLKDLHKRINLQLLKTKVFDCGAVTLYYTPAN